MIGCDSLRRLASPRVVIAFAWITLAAVSGECQSSSGAQAAGCLTVDHQTAVAGGDSSDAIGVIDPLVLEIRSTSFPALTHINLRVRAFRSQSDYFRTRFSLSRFVLFMPMPYFVDVNPALFLRPPFSEGVCAILAHELAHVVSLSRGNRIRRLGLVRLISQRYTVKFERGADLEAIHRGYADGLKTYRAWVSTHIPRRQTSAKTAELFFSGGDHSYPGEIAGAARSLSILEPTHAQESAGGSAYQVRSGKPGCPIDLDVDQAPVPVLETSRTRLPALAPDRSLVFAIACGALFSTGGAGRMPFTSST